MLIMKKLVLFIFAVFIFINLAKAESTVASSVARTDKYSHWSIMINGGFDMLITERTGGDVMWLEHQMTGKDTYYNGNMAANFKDNFSAAVSFQADYMFTPQFGLRLQYLYAPINKKAIYIGENDKIFSDKNGNSHQATLQLEVNMLNLFYRCRSNTQWGWYIGGGVGAMFYKIPRSDFQKYRPVVCIPINTSVEYSPISSLSVVFHAELDWYGDDEVNGVDMDDQVNDMGLYVGLGLRYNIAATKDPHVRVNDMCSFEPLRVSKATDSGKSKFKENQTTKEDIEELQDKMDELEKRNRELQDKIELMNRDIMERLDKYFTDDSGDSSKGSAKSDTSTDGKKSKGDKDSKNRNKSKSKSSAKNSEDSKTNQSIKNEPKNEPVNVYGPTEDEGAENTSSSPVPKESEIKQQQIFNEAMLSNGTEANEVIFDLESSRVKSKFEVKIGAVAKRMLANKKLKLDIIAYIKKENLTKTNVKLATQRLEAIYYILINRYQIDPNRVRYDIQDPVEGDDGADIRCDMVYR